MSEKTVSNDCLDPTIQSLTVHVPCQLVERVERYARDNDYTIAGVLIEALDKFLREE